MPSFLKQGNAKLYFLLAALLVVLLASRLGESITASFNALPVLQAPRAALRPIALDAASLYPVWVKQVRQGEARVADAPLDRLFRKEPQTPRTPAAAPEPSPEQRLLDQWQRTLQVDGIADNGAFLSGRFYRLHAPLTELAALDSQGLRLVPHLAAVSAQAVTLRAGTHSLTLTVRERH